jgi:hypothetical protein
MRIYFIIMHAINEVKYGNVVQNRVSKLNSHATGLSLD